MPNHVSNVLTLRCTEAEAAKVFAEISGVCDDGTPRLFDFDKLIPYPQHFEALDVAAAAYEKEHPGDWQNRPKDGFNQGGYEWCCENWGTKWNAYDGERRSPLTIYFETAWSFPAKIAQALADKYPDLHFIWEWADEDRGSNAGMIRVRGGKVVGKITYEGTEGVRHWFSLNPNANPKEYSYDPVTWLYIPEDE